MIDFDAISLPSSGQYEMTTGATYVLNRPKPLRCRLIGNGAAIRYLVGPEGSQALQTVAGVDGAGSENIVFDIAPGCYALGGEGGFRGTASQIHGGGGAFHLHGNTHKVQLIGWATADTVKNSYAGYRGPKVTDDPTHGVYKSDPVADLELINFEIRKGVTGKYHGLRDHGGIVRIHGGRLTFAPDATHYTAALRLHDLVEAEIIGLQVVGGNVAFGPMQEDDGGRNIGVPTTKDATGKTIYHYDQPLIQSALPKRKYYDDMRLGKLTLKGFTHDGLRFGTFKLNCGILAGSISDAKLLNLYGSSAVIVQYPYMNRPANVLTMDHVTATLANGGAKPKFFSDDNAAKNIRVTNATLQGKPFTH